MILLGYINYKDRLIIQKLLFVEFWINKLVSSLKHANVESPYRPLQNWLASPDGLN